MSNEPLTAKQHAKAFIQNMVSYNPAYKIDSEESYEVLGKAFDTYATQQLAGLTAFYQKILNNAAKLARTNYIVEVEAENHRLKQQLADKEASDV